MVISGEFYTFGSVEGEVVVVDMIDDDANLITVKAVDGRRIGTFALDYAEDILHEIELIMPVGTRLLIGRCKFVATDDKENGCQVFRSMGTEEESEISFTNPEEFWTHFRNEMFRFDDRTVQIAYRQTHGRKAVAMTVEEITND